MQRIDLDTPNFAFKIILMVCWKQLNFIYKNVEFIDLKKSIFEINKEFFGTLNLLSFWLSSLVLLLHSEFCTLLLSEAEFHISKEVLPWIHSIHTSGDLSLQINIFILLCLFGMGFKKWKFTSLVGDPPLPKIKKCHLISHSIMNS